MFSYIYNFFDPVVNSCFYSTMKKIKNEAIGSTFTLLILSLAVQPWRNTVSQDDAAYAAQAIHFSMGHFQFHPDSIAFLLPQTLVGATALRALSFMSHPLMVLNCLTWLLFCGLAWGLRKKFKLGLSLWLSFLAVPFWIQYGASFLYDLWAVGLLAILLVFENEDPALDKPAHYAALGGISLLLPLQLQVLSIFPVLFGLRNWLQKSRKRAWSLWLGVALGLLVYLNLKKSVSQQALPSFLLIHHQNIQDVFATFFQLLLSLGFFFLPWIRPFRNLSSKLLLGTASIQLLCLIVFVFSSVHILAAGVFFSDYLPRICAAFLATMGIWGWAGTFDLFKDLRLSRIWPSLTGIGIIFSAYSFRGITDLRCAMIALPLVLFLINSKKLEAPRLGSYPIVALLGLCLSLILNLYQLDTTEARWQVASKLEARGVDTRDISAGYGRNHFKLEWDCVEEKIRKMGNPQPTDPSFLNEVYAYIPRYYEKGWSPQYLIKPSRFFNKKLDLKSNRMKGQDTAPIQTVQYRSAGITHELGVYRNDDFQQSECFR